MNKLQYFKPTIDINKLQYISSSAQQCIIAVISLEISSHFNDLFAGLLVVFKYLKDQSILCILFYMINIYLHVSVYYYMFQCITTCFSVVWCL